MAAAVRWLALLGCFAFLLVLGGPQAARWAHEWGLFERPNEYVEMATGFATAAALHPGFFWAFVAAVAFAAGAWIERLARGADEARDRKQLGRELMALGRKVDGAQGERAARWPQNIEPLLADLRSAFHRLSRLGIWSPDQWIFQRPDANLLISYLNVIGTLLHDGHLTEAKDDALRCRDVLRAERAQRRAFTLASSRDAPRGPSRPGPRLVHASPR